MALTEKKRKKLTRWIGGADEKFNLVFVDLCIQYFVVMCLTIFFDKIAKTMLWNYQKGFGYAQGIVVIVCIIQIGRYARRVKK